MSFQTAHSYHFHRFSESVSQTNVVTVYQRDSSSSEAVTRTSEPSSDPLYVLTIPPPPTLFKAFNLSTRVYIGPSPGCVLIPQKSDYKPLHCELKIPALETPRINQHFIFSIDSTPPVTFTCHEYNVKTPLTTDQSPVKCVFSWNSVPTRWRQVTLGANNDIAQFVLEVQVEPDLNDTTSIATGWSASSNLLPRKKYKQSHKHPLGSPSNSILLPLPVLHN
ncbi:hypothetical protein BCR33DRAFT_330300 [Rhizoclosmatium globosum]|uniref:Uncharacterized protein n=1 Tax=Rhizoclosmatium globosum TaxID=329046 RepID=A0A1Y2C4R8_9FUNG|nr:hypothetical protein BCR33DRAFT_330300 [Rhizoclosmatium globosum]|eukprot:ORY42040.1 hypothetical protein BCR33DRAFT_330300 [Rhizoclosmatium globosum]